MQINKYYGRVIDKDDVAYLYEDGNVLICGQSGEDIQTEGYRRKARYARKAHLPMWVANEIKQGRAVEVQEMETRKGDRGLYLWIKGAPVTLTTKEDVTSYEDWRSVELDGKMRTVKFDVCKSYQKDVYVLSDGRVQQVGDTRSVELSAIPTYVVPYDKDCRRLKAIADYLNKDWDSAMKRRWLSRPHTKVKTGKSYVDKSTWDFSETVINTTVTTKYETKEIWDSYDVVPCDEGERCYRIEMIHHEYTSMFWDSENEYSEKKIVACRPLSSKAVDTQIVEGERTGCHVDRDICYVTCQKWEFTTEDGEVYSCTLEGRVIESAEALMKMLDIEPATMEDIKVSISKGSMERKWGSVEYYDVYADDVRVARVDGGMFQSNVKGSSFQGWTADGEDRVYIENNGDFTMPFRLSNEQRLSLMELIISKEPAKVYEVVKNMERIEKFATVEDASDYIRANSLYGAQVLEMNKTI